jgi:hypothetical protein
MRRFASSRSTHARRRSRSRDVSFFAKARGTERLGARPGYGTTQSWILEVPSPLRTLKLPSTCDDLTADSS